MTAKLPTPTDIEQIEDPIERARAAYDALDRYNDALHEVSEVRRRALMEVIASNRTLEEAGRLLGISRQSVYRAVTMDRPATLADDPAFVAWVNHGEGAVPKNPDLIQPFLRPGENWQDAMHRERGRRKAVAWLEKQQATDQQFVEDPAVQRWLNEPSAPPDDRKVVQWASRFLPDGQGWDDDRARSEAATAIRRRFSVA